MKVFASPIAATRAVAITGPILGTAVRRSQAAPSRVAWNRRRSSAASLPRARGSARPRSAAARGPAAGGAGPRGSATTARSSRRPALEGAGQAGRGGRRPVAGALTGAWHARGRTTACAVFGRRRAGLGMVELLGHRRVAGPGRAGRAYTLLAQRTSGTVAHRIGRAIGVSLGSGGSAAVRVPARDHSCPAAARGARGPRCSATGAASRDRSRRRGRPCRRGRCPGVPELRARRSGQARVDSGRGAGTPGDDPAVGLPADLFVDVPPHEVELYRWRVAVQPPSDLRRLPEAPRLAGSPPTSTRAAAHSPTAWSSCWSRPCTPSAPVPNAGWSSRSSAKSKRVSGHRPAVRDRQRCARRARRHGARRRRIPPLLRAVGGREVPGRSLLPMSGLSLRWSENGLEFRRHTSSLRTRVGWRVPTSLLGGASADGEDRLGGGDLGAS